MSLNTTDATTNITIFNNTSRSVISNDQSAWMKDGTLHDFSKQLSWGSLLIFVLSVFGNTIIIIVMHKPRNRELTTSTFFTGLAISDLLHALQVSLKKWMFYIVHLPVVTSSTPTSISTFVYALAMVNLYISTWILVAVTMERVLCVTIPHKIKNLCTPFSAKLCILFIVVLCFIFCMSVYYFLIEVIVLDDTEITGALEKIPFGLRMFTLSDAVLGFLLPLVIIIVGSIIISVHLYRKAGNSMASSRAHSATRSLIFANIAFIITISPLRIFYNTISLLQTRTFTTTTDLIRNLVYLPAEANSALNFFVYCLGSARFREDVKEVFGFKTKTASRSTMSSTISTN